MSDLLKKTLKGQQQNKPPFPKKQMQNEDEDEADEKEEEQDQFDVDFNKNTIPVKLQGSKPQPIKADHNITHSHHQNPQQAKVTKKIHDYSPQQWNDFYDEMIFHPNGTPIYIAGKNKAPIYLCLHGAGHSAMSFANLANEVKQYATLISFDFRGHGQSKIELENPNLSVQQLLDDVVEIFDYVTTQWPKQTVIIVGHSMGGAIAAKSANLLITSQKADKVQGLIVIDVVEGSAIEALPFMEQIVNNRPKHFKSYEQAIQWSLNTSTLMTLSSARVSIPAQLKEVKDQNGNVISLDWKVDLLKTAPYWMGWFEGLTNQFLQIRIPKILMLAEKERLDKDLTVAQMQGKFRLIVLQNTGHSIQEDDPKSTAYNFHDFILKFRIPTTVEEVEKLKQVGIGKFHPTIGNYEYQQKYY
ncbi:unnamed protein product [Paramecium octaurelia]|uniref:AB hydrolase-1 domain-containing protein n=1 Tax=Paramecium octaurelia TaxID=43137 RepID=A0A8S1UM42_PAROT|nr:unnamed protein product [Paramecium octaurelia]